MRLTLWWRVTDLREEAAGPMVASRLGGLAWELATTLCVVRNGTEIRGDAALALQARSAGTDQFGNSYPALLSGLGELLKVLHP